MSAPSPIVRALARTVVRAAAGVSPTLFLAAPGFAALGFAAALAPVTALAQSAQPGQPAPAFTLADTAGRKVSLADLRGRTVVLEWTNPNCPFVRKHYESGNLPGLQAKYRADVAWIAINSTHPAHVDYLAPDALAGKLAGDWKGVPTAVLMDPDGAVGRAYGARTTPQMWVIDATGVIRFAGGIDDRRSADPADIPLARNFVAAALEDLKAGRPVATPSAPPYGCSVKYQ